MNPHNRGAPNRQWQFVFLTGALLVAIAVLGGVSGRFTMLHAVGVGLIGAGFVFGAVKKRGARPWRTRPRSNSR